MGGGSHNHIEDHPKDEVIYEMKFPVLSQRRLSNETIWQANSIWFVHTTWFVHRLRRISLAFFVVLKTTSRTYNFACTTLILSAETSTSRQYIESFILLVPHTPAMQ
jgi:hypothetical protein